MITFSDGKQYETTTDALLDIPIPQDAKEPPVQVAQLKLDKARPTVFPIPPEAAANTMEESIMPIQNPKDQPIVRGTLGAPVLQETLTPNPTQFLPPSDSLGQGFLFAAGFARGAAARPAPQPVAPRTPGPLEDSIVNDYLRRVFGTELPGQPGSIAAQGSQTFQRELRRDPVGGQFRQLPEDFGGTAPYFDQQREFRNRVLRESNERYRRGGRNELLESSAIRRQAFNEGRPLTIEEVSQLNALSELLQPVQPRRRYLQDKPVEARTREAEASRAMEGRIPGSGKNVKFTYDDGSAGSVNFNLSNEGKNIHVSWMGKDDGSMSGMQGLGRKKVTEILDQVRDIYPDAESITGFRISGVRGHGAGSGSGNAIMRLPKRKNKSN